MPTFRVKLQAAPGTVLDQGLVLRDANGTILGTLMESVTVDDTGEALVSFPLLMLPANPQGISVSVAPPPRSLWDHILEDD